MSKIVSRIPAIPFLSKLRRPQYLDFSNLLPLTAAKLICWPCLIVTILFSASGLAGLPETLALVKPGVVAVGTVQRTRSPRDKFLGTGFVVGDGHYVVTNAHVIPVLLAVEKMEHLAIFTGHGKQSKMRKAKRVAVDPAHDLALLRIEGAPLPSLRLGDSEWVREGQSIAFTGFPIGTVLGLFPVTHRGIISAISPIAIPSQSSNQLDPKLIKRLRAPFDVFQLDATAYPGNSGSPVYDPKTGDVLGVLNMVFVKETKESVLDKPSGISFAIPVKYIRELLGRIPSK
jgi:serine protease Do